MRFAGGGRLMAASPSDLQHLLRRAGFGATPAQLASFAGLELSAVVDALLAAVSPPDPPPVEIDNAAVSDFEQWIAATHWWIDRMATTAAPLVEKMTLFWHGHFVSGSDKVGDMGVMWRQLSLYRNGALGNFRTLAQAMALDPAMLRYLDNDRNVKGAPNENFARELMELFLLGADLGNYTQDDVIASARAWTGYGLKPDTWQYQFDPNEHDGGSKTFLGVTANLDGPGIINTIFDHPDKGPIMARFIARKLWEFFAHPSPPPSVITALATELRSNNYELKPLLRALFLRPEFYLPAAKQGLVRSPIEWVVALMKATGLDAATVHPEWFIAAMGQQPYSPPNVAGWKSNAYWISATTANARADCASFVSYKASEAGFLGTTGSLAPATAVDNALAAFNIDRPTAGTRNALIAWLTSQRAVPYTAWLEQKNLIVLVALSPEMQLA
jgi:uncharacterized protein (DUF1800 family)